MVIRVDLICSDRGLRCAASDDIPAGSARIQPTVLGFNGCGGYHRAGSSTHRGNVVGTDGRCNSRTGGRYCRIDVVFCHVAHPAAVWGGHLASRYSPCATQIRTDVVEHRVPPGNVFGGRSEEHTSELQSRGHLVCRLLLEKKNKLST